MPHGERIGVNSGVVGSDFGDSSVGSVAASSVMRGMIDRVGEDTGADAGALTGASDRIFT